MRAHNVEDSGSSLGQMKTRRAIVVGITSFLMLTGCNQFSPQQSEKRATEPAVPLRVLVVDDPPLADAIERQWASRSESPLALRQCTSAELRQASKLDADVLIYSSQLLGELVENDRLAAIPSSSLDAADIAWYDLFDLIRTREVTWGEKTYAFPLGAASYVLWYRPDIFAALELQVPTTWRQYEELANRLSERSFVGSLVSAEGQPWSGTLEPLGPGWAASTFLAHAAPLARHHSQYSTLFDFSSMQPLIAGPPFIESLERLSGIVKASPRSATMSPDDVRQAFVRGECAMAISWPSHAIPQEPAAPLLRAAKFAELPGSDQAYNFREQRWESRRPEDSHSVPLLGVAGRLASITRESTRTRSALNMLQLLASAEWSSSIATHSSATAPFRISHSSQSSSWVDEGLERSAAGEYFELLQKIQTKSLHLMSLRIPGSDEYQEALDGAVRATVAGELPAADALTSVADRWTVITDQRGKVEQRRAYRRSLGLEK